MKILALIMVISVLFIPTLSAINAPSLMIGPFPYEVDNSSSSTQSEIVESTTTIIEKIKMYANEIKNYLMNLPQELWDQLMEILPDSIQERINL